MPGTNHTGRHDSGAEGPATMDLSYPAEAEAFRSQVRTWLIEHLPAGWTEGQRPSGDELRRFGNSWHQLLQHHGWSVPTWPTEYGGRGLSAVEAVVLTEELARLEAPIQPPTAGEILVGPTILHWGDDALKSRFLPAIARGQETWCQGFSEPEAGSDLASLATTAARDGDEWVINGTKIWTSEAQDADLIFMLVRTNPTAPLHRGISYLLVPMHQPGIEVRPIPQVDGTGGFNQVVFTAARCPATWVVGGVDNGWTVAMSTLGFERGTSASTDYRRFANELDQLIGQARQRGRLADPLIRQRVAEAWTQVQIMRVNGYRLVTGIVHPEQAESLGPLAATTKLHWTEFHQRLTNLSIDVLGAEGQVLSGVTGGPPVVGVGLGFRPPYHDYPASPAQSSFLFSRSGTIFGGTSEVQRNVIAERVLGLPREPRPAH